MKASCSIFLLLFCSPLLSLAMTPGQTLGGVPGFIRAPTAEMLRDGTFCFGASYIPKEILNYTEHRRNAVTVFASLTFLPFLELDLRLTRQLDLPKEATHTVDRSPVLRIRLQRETKKLPALVLGFHDLFSTIEEGTARHFAATYLVVGKRLTCGTWGLYPSLGYSHPLYANQQSEIEGWFGGVRLEWRRLPGFSLSADWVNQRGSFGIAVLPARWLHIKGAMFGADTFACNLCMQFNLFSVFKR
ncbi:MAG: YjbH domain-containing protein [candidate division KSB1 bacterium]|nr:YjbH domain-containing protein [candidate division KSB1 bacterium]MDZ7345155.1 YjbH domain-containing protein [candidate division KSB1 bacterium]